MRSCKPPAQQVRQPQAQQYQACIFWMHLKMTYSIRLLQTARLHQSIFLRMAQQLLPQ